MKLQFLLVLPLLGSAGCACFNFAAYQPTPDQGVKPLPPVHSSAPYSSLILEAKNARAVEREHVFDEATQLQIHQAAGDRSPETAFCLACLIAGGGHFYTGETVKGAALLGITTGSLVAGAALSGGYDEGDCQYNPETFECESSGGNTPLWVGAGVAAASWIYGIIDARASARRVNQRNTQNEPGAALETRPWLGIRRGQPNAGVQFKVAW